MAFDVEVLLKGTDEVVTETVTHDGPEPSGWIGCARSAAVHPTRLRPRE